MDSRRVPPTPQIRCDRCTGKSFKGNSKAKRHSKSNHNSNNNIRLTRAVAEAMKLWTLRLMRHLTRKMMMMKMKDNRLRIKAGRRLHSVTKGRQALCLITRAKSAMEARSTMITITIMRVRGSTTWILPKIGKVTSAPSHIITIKTKAIYNITTRRPSNRTMTWTAAM